MDDYRDGIRDRTLVLRVLVPSLEARLREKMKEAEDVAGSRPSKNNEPKNILQDLEGVTCEPTKDGSTLWNFHCDGATYPARLVNLPCPVELHKTHDHAMYYKCVDIGQMLIVYEDEMALEEAEAAPKSEGFPSYYPSGLTPPMKRVVERRFEAREHKALAPSRPEVTEVETELAQLMDRIAKNPGGRTKKKLVTNIALGSVLEEVEEDVVDYEPWMDDYGKQPDGVEFDDQDNRCTKHPELWLSADKIDEIKKQKAEQKEKEAAAAAAATAAAEAKKKKAAARKEVAAKKKAKKKDEGPSVKKGIPSKKNVEAVNEVDQAAAQMSQDFDGEDFLEAAIENDDYFNFDGGDDIFEGIEL